MYPSLMQIYLRNIIRIKIKLGHPQATVPFLKLLTYVPIQL
jgi:hypothetical protein